jgi:putative hydrolase of the HAD superfamily
VETIKTQAITFDVGGTLIEPWPSVGDIYAQVACEHGFKNLSADQINAQFNEAWSQKEEFQYSEEHWLELVSKSFAHLLSESESAHIFPSIYRRFEESDVWKIHDDVLPTLDELADRGFRMAVVSNWDTRLRPLLKNLKLLSYFETATISSEIGFTKPSPVLFEHTLKKLGLPPSSVVHVGDSATEDVDGAESAGVSGILVRRNGKTGVNSIGKLTDLSRLLVEDW